MNANHINILKNGISVLLLFLALNFTGCKNNDENVLNTTEDDNEAGDNTGEQRATGQYMVIFRSNQSGTVGQAATGGSNLLQQQANRILKDKGVKELNATPLATFSGITSGLLIKLEPDQINALKNDPAILRVEEDMGFTIGKPSGKGKPTKTTTTTTTTTTTSGSTSTYTAYTPPPQPAQTVPWGIDAVGGSVSAAGKTAWIVDTGIDFGHPDLTVDQTRSRSFLYSYNTANNYQSPNDEHGHGTNVAGIIGAKNNTIGVVGVAANATVVSCRAMDKNGYGYVSSVVNAINYIAANAKPGDVANFSISFGSSSTMDDAIRNLASKGVYVIIGAGNSATDCSTCSPARVDAPNVYTISGMDRNEVFVSSSNFGKPVDYCAPGAGIYTTGLGGYYVTVGGTSFATAHASGVLLATSGQPKHFTYVKCDPDPYVDPVIHRHPKP